MGAEQSAGGGALSAGGGAPSVGLVVSVGLVASIVAPSTAGPSWVPASAWPDGCAVSQAPSAGSIGTIEIQATARIVNLQRSPELYYTEWVALSLEF